MNADIRRAAEDLARSHGEGETTVVEILLFEDDAEIRLVEVDTNTPPNEEEVAPFYFGSNKAQGVPFPIAIALIRPEEKGHLTLPNGWGDWADAVSLFERKTSTASVGNL